MKLNCDMAEGAGCEAALMPYLDQANIACGAHAGGPELMRSIVALARQHDVSIGAHPGYPDREHFGRESLSATPDQIQAWVTEQVERLAAMGPVDYVKPHGALYHDMLQQPAVMEAIRHAIGALPLMGPAPFAGGLDWSEAFADRRYQTDGTLMPRNVAGAVLNEAETLAQVRQLIADGTVTTAGGDTLPLAVTTLCVHGDNPAGVRSIRAIREILDAG